MTPADGCHRGAACDKPDDNGVPADDRLSNDCACDRDEREARIQRRALDRLALGRAAVLPVAEAVRLLPMRDGEARGAIARSGVVRSLAGRRVVVWGELCDALLESEGAAAPPAPPSRPSPRLPRFELPRSLGTRRKARTANAGSEAP